MSSREMDVIMLDEQSSYNSKRICESYEIYFDTYERRLLTRRPTGSICCGNTLGITKR